MRDLLIAKNTFFQAFARAATSFVGFLITIIIAREFGVVGFGDFTKVTSYVALSYLIVDFGFNAVFLQYEKPNFKNLFYLRILISVFLFFILNAIAFFLPYNQSLNSGFSEELRFGIFIFSFGVFFQGVIMSALAIFQKSLNYYSYMLGMIVGAVFNLFIVFTLTFLNFSIFYIYISFIFSSFVTSVILLKFTKEKIWPFSLNKGFIKEMFSKSLPIGLMLVFNLFYFRADMFILSVLSSAKDVGIYGFSYKFFDFLIALPLFLSNAVYPFLIQAKNDKAKLNLFVKKYFFIFLFSSFLIIIPFWFISPIFTLVSPDFSFSIVPFRILLLSLPFFFVTSFLQWVLIALKKQQYLMYAYLISAILNVILNVIFIPKFSYIASSTITVLSEGFVFALLFVKIISLNKLVERKTQKYG